MAESVPLSNNDVAGAGHFAIKMTTAQYSPFNSVKVEP